MIPSEKKTPNKNLINTLFNSNPKYKDPKACAAAKTSTFTGFYNAGYYAGAFFAAPILGALSDAIGRRPVMIIAIVSESYVFSKLFVINIGVFFEIKNFPQKKKNTKNRSDSYSIPSGIYLYFILMHGIGFTCWSGRIQLPVSLRVNNLPPKVWVTN